MTKPRYRWWLKPWCATEEKFSLPSVEPGISFTVTLSLKGLRRGLTPENSAKNFARGIAVDAIARTTKRFSVLHADAAAIAATSACLAEEHMRPGLHITDAEVKLVPDPQAKQAAMHLEVLRRIADVAGKEAVMAAAQADAIRQVVLSDHTTTVAHLLSALSAETDIVKDSMSVRNLSQVAAELRRSIDDYRPDDRWIRVAEALNSLTSRSTPEEINDMVKNLADWATVYDKPLANSLESTLTNRG